MRLADYLSDVSLWMDDDDVQLRCEEAGQRNCGT